MAHFCQDIPWKDRNRKKLSLRLGVIQATLGAPFGGLSPGLKNMIKGSIAPFKLAFHTLLLPVSFFGIGTAEMTLEEIGEKFGLTRERVRQIKEKAIRRLRHSSRSKQLKTYLG